MHPDYQTILVNTNNHIATITLNRPEVRNAINGTLAKELKQAFDRLSDDANIKVIVLTGSGTSFCSGQDLNEFENLKHISIQEVLHERYNPLIMSMHNCPKVIIGKINGHAAGAGLSLALGCDFTLAIESAVFSMSFVNIGLVPDCGAAYFLPRLVGRAKAFELATLGYSFSAKDAHNIGMINMIVEHENILQRKTDELAERYAQGPTQTLGMIKQLLNRSFGHSLDKMLEKEASYQEKAGSTRDFQEGIHAFREKRKPVFTGK
jgi:2-(1,2-epoxy-1,2-dihydrophenyl)acetyl-CoA isomerase